MKKFGQVCRLTDENRDQYISLHQKIPPNIAKLIFECNLRNYSIFIKDDMLFAYFEYIGSDFEQDMHKMSVDKDNQQWWNLVKPLMSPLDTRQPNEFWANMESIFYQE